MRYRTRVLGALMCLTLLIGLLGAGWAVEAVRFRANIEIAGAELRAEQVAAEADKLSARALLPEGMEAEYIGEFLCTSYDKNCPVCGTTDICYSGEPFVAGVSCALNKSMLEKFPMGTWLYIEGVGIRKVSDIGGGVNQNQIDIAVAGTHEEALHWSGYGFHDVWVISFEKT